MKLILASSSPRRKDILDSLQFEYTIIHPSADESVSPFESPENYASRISAVKALAVSSGISSGADTVVIGADTIVTIDGEILGKPRDHAEAFGMLEKLSGRTHEVITALTIARRIDGNETVMTRLSRTAVSFKNLGREGIREYLSLIEYSDKAGSYAFQEHREFIIAEVDGSLTNVIGFPLRTFFSMLSELDLVQAIFNIETGNGGLPFGKNNITT